MPNYIILLVINNSRLGHEFVFSQRGGVFRLVFSGKRGVGGFLEDEGAKNTVVNLFMECCSGRNTKFSCNTIASS